MVKLSEFYSVVYDGYLQYCEGSMCLIFGSLDLLSHLQC